MADKITVAEAVSLANQDTKDLTNEQLTQMNEAFAESFFNREQFSDEAKMANEVTLAEIDSRLETLNQSQNPYDEKELDSIIAMAESVGMFSQKSNIAKAVLDKAQKQKADLEATAQNTTQNTAQNTTQDSDEISIGAEDTVKVAEENTDAESNTTSNEDQNQKTENTAEKTEDNQAEDTNAETEELTQEQLEANDKILDDFPQPFTLGKDSKLLNQEFATEYTALKNLTITNETGRDLTDEEQEEARLSLYEAAQLEAETYARAEGNGNPEDVKKLYNARFKEALQNNIVASVFATEFAKGMSEDQIADKFIQAVEKPQKADLKAINAVAAQSANNSQNVVNKLKEKFKSIPVIEKMDNKIKNFDKKMTDRYGDLYTISRDIALNVGKVALNIGKYTALSTLAGANAPLVFAGIAAKGAYDTLVTMRKEAKKEKKTFYQYFKENKFKVSTTCATSALALGGAIMGFSGGSENADTRSQMTTISRSLAVFKHAAPAFLHTASGMYKKYVKKDENGAAEDFKKSKGEWKQSAMALAGVLTGKEFSPLVSDSINEGINEAKDYVSNAFGGAESQEAAVDGITGESPRVAETTQSAQMTPEEMSKALAAMGLHPDDISRMDPQAMQAYINMHPQDFAAVKEVMQDNDKDGIADVYDTDHGQGWATANETQLDRLMDADPAKINALLNDGQWHSSTELKEMMENGKFNDEQLKAIHGLASREFDENGHIIDANLKDYYDNLAKEAAAKAAQAAQETVKGPENTLPEAQEEQVQAEVRTPEQQRAYEAVMDIISKGENLDDPEVKASLEGMAASYVEQLQTAINNGDNVTAANLVANLHNQGENQEIAEATRADENDSRKMANAKEDVLEAKAKLDEAHAALAQDPNNEKLQKEVAKLEQKFDRASLDLEQRAIKETDSELKDQIKHDEKAYDNRDKAYETIEKNFGLSEDQVNQGLASMGIDINNLPQDISTLSPEAQNLLNIHGMYAQAHQNEADLQNRIQANEQNRDALKELEKESKQEEKNVKKGLGLSIDAQERLAGQSQIENSELLHAVVGMQNETAQAQEMKPQTTEQNRETQSDGRKVSELRGTVGHTPSAPVKQTTMNTQTMVSTKAKEMS